MAVMFKICGLTSFITIDVVRLTITLITSTVMKLVRIFILNATNGPVVLVYITAQSVFYNWPTN